MLAADPRYARHQLIPEWDQQRLADATAIVVGVGALGNEVAKNLALAGIGRLVLCDPDVVEASNLSRTVLFDAADAAGALKVEAAAAALRRLAPGISVHTRPHELGSGVGLGELADAAVVFGCLDSRRARLRLLSRCALVEARLVDGGTEPWGGEIRVRTSTARPCYGCAMTAHQRAESDLPWSCADAGPPGGPAGASIAPTALIAGWMTLLGLRVAFARQPDYDVVRVDGAQGFAAPVAVDRDPACPYHRPIGGAEPVAVSAQADAGTLLAEVAADQEPLTWEAFRLAGRCATCGKLHETALDAGAASRVCDSCLRRIRLPFSQRIRDAAASQPLRGLGVAPEEILAVSLPEGGIRWIRLSR